MIEISLVAFSLAFIPQAVPDAWTVDSIDALHRAGQWQEAAALARSGLAANPAAADACTFRVQLAFSRSRLGQLDRAAEELRTFDEDCTGTAVARARANMVNELQFVLDLPSLPETGVDFTALDHFWAMVDTLSRGGEPSEAQWQALFTAPGYRLVIGNVQTVRRDLELAFRPANRALRDSLVQAQNDQASRLRHLTRAASLRDALTALRDSLARAAPLAEAMRNAAEFLPSGAIDGRAPPLVAVAIFRNDGYAGSRGIVIDLLYVHDNGMVPLLSHEFHHVYAFALFTMARPPGDSAEAQMLAALSGLRTEGIADLVDKTYPLVAKSAALERYAQRYNAEYERTPSVLQSLDSLLVAASEGPEAMRAAGRQARSLLWSNGHAHGAYMARTIHETFGPDSLWSGMASPFAFLRIFTAARRRRGAGPTFSDGAVAHLDALERKYTRE
jgi:hypothetical protein